MKMKDKLQGISRELLEAMSSVFGPNSAASKALAEAARLEGSGKKVLFFRSKGKILVKALPKETRV